MARPDRTGVPRHRAWSTPHNIRSERRTAGQRLRFFESHTNMTAVAASPLPSKPGMEFKQFVALIAALMAVNALAIDSMLPALPAIGHSVGIGAGNENQQQWIVTSYLLGFGAAQIVYGPLADRFGRKPILLAGLAIYVLFSGAAAFSTTMPVLLLARVLQGVGSAATRVLAGFGGPGLLLR